MNITELAREAGFLLDDGIFANDQWINLLERFTALAIKARDKELLAGSGEPVAWCVRGLITDFSRDFSGYQTKTYTSPLYTADQMAAAVLRERERCTLVCINNANNQQ